MKKFFSIIMALLLIVAMFVVGGCSTQQTNEGDQSLQKILDKGYFILGLDSSFPPMGFLDEDNNIVGFDIDVAREVCKRMGIELKLQPIEWDNNIMELNQGNIDCVWNGMSINEERREKMNLSEPYMNNSMVFVVKGDSTATKLEDLKGKKIDVQNGSTAQGLLEDCAIADSIEIIPVTDNVFAFNDLDIDGCDAVFLDIVVAEYYITTMKKDFKVLDDGFEKEEYAIGFRKNDNALRDKVQSILSEMKKDGKLAEISTKWFGKDVTIVK